MMCDSVKVLNTFKYCLTFDWDHYEIQFSIRKVNERRVVLLGGSKPLFFSIKGIQMINDILSGHMQHMVHFTRALLSTEQSQSIIWYSNKLQETKCEHMTCQTDDARLHYCIVWMRNFENRNKFRTRSWMISSK